MRKRIYTIDHMRLIDSLPNALERIINEYARGDGFKGWTKEEIVDFIIYKDATGVYFDDLDLSNCAFISVNLSFATFKNTNLCGTKFRDCSLIKVIMSESDFTGAEILDSNCTFSVMEECVIHDAKFHNSYFTFASFCGSEITNTVISKCNLMNAHLDHTQLENAEISRCNLTSASVDNMLVSKDSIFDVCDMAFVDDSSVIHIW